MRQTVTFPPALESCLATREAARKFHFLREIAAGGFGSVYLAKVMHSDGFSRLAAVKLLHQQWSENQEIARRMRDEARLLGWLRHRNIVDVIGLTTIGGRVAVVMEYLEAVDFKAVVQSHVDRGWPVPPRGALEAISFVASALDAAYNRPPYQGEKPLRVIHRDIKPSNIMLDESGTVKVLDFGVARAEFDQRESNTQEMQFGSIEYMAPERLFMEPDTPASDVYSLGATLFELLALERFGKARSRPERHAQYLDERLEFLRATTPTMAGPAGDQLIEFLRTLLAHSADVRPTASEVVSRCRVLARTLDGDGLTEWAETVIPPLVKAMREAPREPNPLTDSVLIEDGGNLAGDDARGELDGELDGDPDGGQSGVRTATNKSLAAPAKNPTAPPTAPASAAPAGAPTAAPATGGLKVDVVRSPVSIPLPRAANPLPRPSNPLQRHSGATIIPEDPELTSSGSTPPKPDSNGGTDVVSAVFLKAKQQPPPRNIAGAAVPAAPPVPAPPVPASPEPAPPVGIKPAAPVAAAKPSVPSPPNAVDPHMDDDPTSISIPPQPARPELPLDTSRTDAARPELPTRTQPSLTAPVARAPEAPKSYKGAIVAGIAVLGVLGVLGAGGLYAVYAYVNAPIPEAEATPSSAAQDVLAGVEAKPVVTGDVLFVSAAPDTAKLTLTCDDKTSSGPDRAAMAAPTAELCRVTVILSDRNRLVTEVSKVEKGTYTCFANGEKACTR